MTPVGQPPRPSLGSGEVCSSLDPELLALLTPFLAARRIVAR